jgi:hypothetical protein
MARPQGRPRVDAPPPRCVIVTLKGSIPYREWLERASRETLIPYSRIVRQALKLWAEKEGLPAPPQR